MTDICSWTGETYVCVCVLLCTWHVGYQHFLFGGHPFRKQMKLGKVRWTKMFRQPKNINFYIKKHNRCSTSLWDTTHPHSFIHTTLTHITEIWLVLNQQPLNPRGSALTFEPQISCQNMWRNVYLTVDPWVPNKEVKVNGVCDLIPCLHHRLIIQQCLGLSTRPSWISWFVLVFEWLCWMKSI